MQHLVCERSCLQWPERTSNSAQLRPAVGQTAGRTFLQSSSWVVTAKTKGWPGYPDRATACPLHPMGYRIQKSALIATYESGGSCDVEDGDLPEQFAGRT